MCWKVINFSIKGKTTLYDLACILVEGPRLSAGTTCTVLGLSGPKGHEDCSHSKCKLLN